MRSDQEAAIETGRRSLGEKVAQETLTHGHDASSSPSPRPLAFSSPFLSFREPDKNIRQLRQLALQGREETLKEKAEGREKVVWGSVDGWRDGQVQREEGEGLALGCGTLPGEDEALQVLGGVVVGGDVGGDSDAGELVREMRTSINSRV